MKTTDWKYDFTSLPRWDNRERIPYVYDEFYEIPQSDSLCCIYSVAEVTMCNYLGFLAILKNKNNPELFLNIADGFNFRPYFCSASTDGNLIFMRPVIHDKKTNSYTEPLLIIDLSENRFAFVITGALDTGVTIVEIKRDLFRIVADERQVDGNKGGNEFRTDCLNWYDLSKLGLLPKFVRKEKKCQFGTFIKGLLNWN